MERLRKQSLFDCILCISIGIASIVLGIALGKGVFPIVGILLTVVLGIFVFGKKEEEYLDYYKKNFISAVIKECVPDATFEPEKGFSKVFINGTELVMAGNRFHSEDRVHGTYKQVPFERCDVRIEEKVRSKNGSYTITYLEGYWIVFPSNKPFTADLQIIRRGYKHAKSKKGIFTRKEERRHEIKTENEEFNKKFLCLCQNDAEAFYLLTPDIMQAIMNLIDVIDGKFIIGFVDNNVHVIVNSKKDSFEPTFIRKNNYDKMVADTKREMDGIIALVEGLKLSHKIYQ